VGNIVYLCEGTLIREGPGNNYYAHTAVPEDDWAVMVIDGPRFADGQVWWDTSRAAAGDPSGGTGWVSVQQAEESCNDDGGGGGGGGDDGTTWEIDATIGLCAGTEIRHGPMLAVHTIVPVDDWDVVITDGPRFVAGQTWWDTSRFAAGDPSGGTGWVSQEQAEASCDGSGEGGYLGLLPLSPEMRAFYRTYGYWPWSRSGGDPVNLSTGSLTQLSTDLYVPGVAGFDFSFQRMYNGSDTRDSALGTGQSSLLDMSLRLANDGSIDVRYPDGHGVYFVVDGDSYVPGQDGILDTLAYEDGVGFDLSTSDQLTYHFDLFDTHAYLTEIRDRHGNTITLERNGDGRVTRIVDTGGREYDLTYEGNHVTSISDPSGRTIRYAYENGDLVSVTDGNGGVSHFEYENHRMTRLTDPEGILYLENIYDGEGRVIEQIDASGSHSYFDYSVEGLTVFTDNLGRQTRYYYDDFYRVTRIEYPLDYAEDFVYDDDYNLVSYTDRRENTWTYIYDERGNRLSENGPLGWHVTYTYNATNDLTSVTDALSRTTVFVWENGNLVRVERADGTDFTFAYDERGQMLSSTNPNGETSYLVYDQYGNLVEVHYPTDCITSYGYDIVGRMTSMTDGNGNTMLVRYDGNDNITRITDPRGHHTNFEYDGNNSLVRMIDRRGGIWTYEYDENLKLVAETDPLGNRTTHTYDAMYNRTSTTDPLRNTTTFRYDALYRLIEVEDALGNITRYRYDANDNLIQVVNALGYATTLEYDQLNRLVRAIDATGEMTEYVYDAVSHLVRTINPRGAVTRYEYDDVDQIVRIIDALGGVTEYEYDDAGNLVTITDANGNTTTFRYDAGGRLIEQEDPEGHVTSYEYDCVSNLILLVDGRGHATHLEYDVNDNLIRVIDALDGETAFTYDEEDALTSITDPNDNTTTYDYNIGGALEQVTEAGGQVTRYEYDAAYNLVALINAKGNTTSFQYDELNRLIIKTDALGYRTTYEYDPLGQLIAVTDANGVVTRYAYDPLNRLAAVVLNYRPGLPADHQTNVRTEYDHDAVGNLSSITDANGNVTTFAYDLLDRLTREVNPIGNTWRYEYDRVGNLTRRVDANGFLTDYTYDADNLLVGIRYHDGSFVAFAYDAAHNQTEMTDWLGTTTNTYDALNRLTSSTNHLGQTVDYAYDPAGNRVSVTYPDGRTIRYEYDANNRISRVVDPDGDIFAVTYDATHNITEILYPNLTRALMTYDAADRLTGVVNEQLDGDVISSFVYTLDAVGNRVRSDEHYRWHQPREISHDYAYDPLYRLVRSEDSEGRFTEYLYDAVGNRLQMLSNYDPLRTPTDVEPYTVEYTYNEANQLLTTDHSVFGITAYTYDANGNRVRSEGPNVWIGNPNDRMRTDYTYDYENHLTWVGNFFDPGNGSWLARDETAMEYDGYGRLFRRMHDMHQGAGGQEFTAYVYDGLDPIVEYVDPSPQYVNYYRGLGRILEMHTFRSQESPVGLSYYYHYDGLGSVSAITKHHGQSAHNYTYWDYGMALDKNDRAADSSNFTAPHNHYTYTGQEWDEYTRLYHFYAREYDPMTGTWLQQDPYRGRLTQPTTLQRYGYVGGNPVNYVDAYGFDRAPGLVGPMLGAPGMGAYIGKTPRAKGDYTRSRYDEYLNTLIRKIYIRQRVQSCNPFYHFGLYRDRSIEYMKYLVRHTIASIPQAPPAEGRLTSGYNDLRSGQYHNAIDIANSLDTPIIATHLGTVTVGELPCKGETITLQDGTVVHCNDDAARYVQVTSDPVGPERIVYTTQYLHLNEAVVDEGERVERGDTIGKMGKTGFSTGVHVHYQILVREGDGNTKVVNPLDFQ